jgi:hypothetical protein
MGESDYRLEAHELPQIGRERKTLSQRWLPRRGADEAKMSQCFCNLVFKIAHSRKFDELGHCRIQFRTLGAASSPDHCNTFRKLVCWSLI